MLLLHHLYLICRDEDLSFHTVSESQLNDKNKGIRDRALCQGSESVGYRIRLAGANNAFGTQAPWEIGPEPIILEEEYYYG